jgi:hypothetical protein
MGVGEGDRHGRDRTVAAAAHVRRWILRTFAVTTCNTTDTGRCATEDEGTRVAENEEPGAGAERFVRRLVALPAFAERPYLEDEWRGTLVIVARGDLELRCEAGGTRRFGRGDILWTEGLGLRAMANPGPVETLLIAVSRAEREPP